MKTQEILKKLESRFFAVSNYIDEAFKSEKKQVLENIDLLGLYVPDSLVEGSSLLYKFTLCGRSYKIEGEILPTIGCLILSTYILTVDKTSVTSESVYELVKGLTFEIRIDVKEKGMKEEITYSMRINGEHVQDSNVGIKYIIMLWETVKAMDKEARENAGLN